MQEEKQRRKGPWSSEEDECLRTYVALLGERRWDSIAKETGLGRSGKSCRLRWLNYLRPNLKHSPISPEEEKMILHLHRNWGNKWAKIARKLPGRTDNEIKNYWRTHLRKNTSATTAMQLQPQRGGGGGDDEELEEEEDEEKEVLHAGYSNSTKAALSISTSNDSIFGPTERIFVKRGSNSSGNLISYGGVVDNYGGQSCNIRLNPADHHVSTSCAVATSPYENHYLHWTSLLLPCGSDAQVQVLDGFDLQNTTFGYPNAAEGSSLLTQQGYCFDDNTLWS